MLAHDAQCAAAGVTTVLDALCLGDLGFDKERVKTFRDAIVDLDALTGTGLLKSDHDLHLVTFDKPHIREFLSHPTSNTTYTVHRNADRAPYVNLLPARSPDGHPTLILGHAAVPGTPFVRALIDNCSSTTVISQAAASLAASPVSGPKENAVTSNAPRSWHSKSPAIRCAMAWPQKSAE